MGTAGRRLTLTQRHKLSLARALVRRSDFYIFNRALPGLDRRVQEEIVKSVMDFLREQTMIHQSSGFFLTLLCHDCFIE